LRRDGRSEPHASKLGIGRSTGNIWKNGTIIRRKDGTINVVPALEPLAVRVISPRFLSQAERVHIADLASSGLGPTAIARALGRSGSTISRELRRNLHSTGQYRPFHAHGLAAVRRRPTRDRKLDTDPVLRAIVIEKLTTRWNPQQISRALRRAYPDNPPAGAATGMRDRPHAAAGSMSATSPRVRP
jgi:IS30 family transposase